MQKTACRPQDLWINLCECNEHRESEALEMAFVVKYADLADYKA